MTKLAPEWVRTSDPVIRSPARYRWTTAAAPSLGEAGRRLLCELLHRYKHVFPELGEPVSGRTTSVQHEILTSDARLVRYGPRRLAPAGLRAEQTCVQEILLGGQIEPSDSPWAFPGGLSD